MVDQNGKRERSTEAARICSSPPTPHRINMTSTTSNEQNQLNGVVLGTRTKNKKGAIKALTPVQPLAKKRAGRPSKKTTRVLSPKTIAIDNTNHKLTEYFPIRRSVRKSKKEVLEEKQRDLESKVLDEVEDGLEVRHFSDKGRGVVTSREFKKGEFVVEYSGELIDQLTAKKREIMYAQEQNAGCYMYYFQHQGQKYCVDATLESNKLGRLVNHSRNGNLLTRIIEVKNKPHLVLIAKEDLSAGVELSYDYGDRSRESLRHHPWLAL